VSARRPPPPGGPEPVVTCVVWLADRRLAGPEHRALLDGAEESRRAAYRSEPDRCRFTVGAALLRLAVAAQTGTRPSAVRVVRDCPRCSRQHGRPRVPGAALAVSVSHSDDLVAVATCRDAEVGVDVEAMRARDVAALARRCLSAAEPLRGPEDFYTYWCRKESVVKAAGAGLRTPLAQVSVSPADQPARLLSYRGAPLAAGLADLEMPPGYAGAVTVLTALPIAVDRRDGALLLSSARDA